VLGEGEIALVHAGTATRFLLVSGEPLREPIARRGPFVMNTEEELDRAWADYRSGRLVGG
jgi:redox-sensitive bicupin YhaK (pirin superfamily)